MPVRHGCEFEYNQVHKFSYKSGYSVDNSEENLLPTYPVGSGGSVVEQISAKV